jgi:16S rRNA (uracil1498-N3)-methyltransferase
MTHIHHRRFFVPAEAIQGGVVEFGRDQAHQIARVLRLAVGDQVAVLDGTGREWTARLTDATPRRVTARLGQEVGRASSPRLPLTLAQVIPRGAAMDLIVEKATELGVTRIVPVEAERSVRRATGRTRRWARIACEAAEQCGRRDLPVLAAPCSLAEWLRQHAAGTPLLACHAGPGIAPLAEVCRELQPVAALTLLVGGEGGLSPDEVARVTSRGARLVWLGPRLLRAETAALVAVALVQALLGDLAVREPV